MTTTLETFRHEAAQALLDPWNTAGPEPRPSPGLPANIATSCDLAGLAMRWANVKAFLGPLRRAQAISARLLRESGFCGQGEVFSSAEALLGHMVFRARSEWRHPDIERPVLVETTLTLWYEGVLNGTTTFQLELLDDNAVEWTGLHLLNGDISVLSFQVSSGERLRRPSDWFNHVWKGLKRLDNDLLTSLARSMVTDLEDACAL